MELWLYTNEFKIWFLTVSATLGVHLSCIAKLFKFSYFGAGKAWLKLRAPSWHNSNFQAARGIKLGKVHYSNLQEEKLRVHALFSK